jgi:hypothetical protein
MGAMGNFDVLPDSIAILIFSKLENAQMVAQCAMVCRRWKVLTGLVDTLTFESFKLLEKKVSSLFSNLVGCFASLLGCHAPLLNLCTWSIRSQLQLLNALLCFFFFKI